MADASARKLGYIESVMAFNHEIFRGTGEIFIGLELELQRKLGDKHFFDAAERLFARFAMLRCSIKRHEDTYWLFHGVSFRDIDVSPVISREQNLDDFVQLELNRKEIDPSRGLWRLVWQRASGNNLYVGLSVHHAIVDGVGTSVLVKNLLELLEYGALTSVEQSDLPDPVDRFLSEKSASEANSQLKAGELSVKFQHKADIDHRRTCFKTQSIHVEETALFESWCKNNSVTENAAITVLFTQACTENGILPPMGIVKTAVSLRDIARGFCTEDNLGCYIDVASAWFQSEGSLAEDATRYEKSLARSIYNDCFRRKEFSVSVADQKFRSDNERSHFDPGVGLTNIGDVSCVYSSEGIRVKRYLPLARRLSASHCCVLHLYKLNAQLHLTIVYADPIFSGQVAERLVVALAEKLVDLAGVYEIPQRADS